MKSLTAAVALLVLCSIASVEVSAAQSPAYRPVPIPGSEVRTLKSSSTGRSYDLYIHKPADFDASRDKKYPVLYLLHGIGGDEAGSLDLREHVELQLRLDVAQQHVRRIHVALR